MVAGYFLEVAYHRFLGVGFGGHLRCVEKSFGLGIELGSARELSRSSESFSGFSATTRLRVDPGGFRVLACA